MRSAITPAQISSVIGVCGTDERTPKGAKERAQEGKREIEREREGEGEGDVQERKQESREKRVERTGLGFAVLARLCAQIARCLE
jgi:hypothetical protein